MSFVRKRTLFETIAENTVQTGCIVPAVGLNELMFPAVAPKGVQLFGSRDGQPNPTGTTQYASPDRSMPLRVKHEPARRKVMHWYAKVLRIPPGKGPNRTGNWMCMRVPRKTSRRPS